MGRRNPGASAHKVKKPRVHSQLTKALRAVLAPLDDTRAAAWVRVWRDGTASVGSRYEYMGKAERAAWRRQDRKGFREIPDRGDYESDLDVIERVLKEAGFLCERDRKHHSVEIREKAPEMA